VGGTLGSAPAQAQSASNLTPDSFQPRTRRLNGTLEFSGAPGLDAPAGADELDILIANVVVEGAYPELIDITRAAETRLTRGRIPVSEIFETASDLEAAYIEAGFVLARVVLPEQSLNDGGTLRLVVVRGFVEEVDLTDTPPRLRRRIGALAEPLVGEPRVTLREIERQLLLAGDTFGVELESALAAGDEPGGTVVLLDPAYRSVTGAVAVDNFVSSAFGGYTLEGGMELNGFLGQGEVVYLRGVGHPQLGGDNGLFTAQPRLRTLVAGIGVPLGRDGLIFGLEATRSVASPDTQTPTRSRFDRLTARLSYPIIRARGRNLNAEVSFEMLTDEEEILADGFMLYEDRLRVLRGGLDYERLTAEGRFLAIDGRLSFGIDAVGARNAAEATPTPLSRQGADADFVELQVSAELRQPLGPRSGLALYARSQTSFGKPLPKSQQLSLVSAQSLSPFAGATLTGDTGLVLRGEVFVDRAVAPAGIALAMRPYLFAAGGALVLHEPTALEQDVTAAGGFGAGVDLFRNEGPVGRSSRLRLELGMGYRNDTDDWTSRVAVRSSIAF